MQVLLLSMSAHITKQLGMAPGGEFRAAYREVRFIDTSLCLSFGPSVSLTFAVIKLLSIDERYRCRKALGIVR